MRTLINNIVKKIIGRVFRGFPGKSVASWYNVHSLSFTASPSHSTSLSFFVGNFLQEARALQTKVFLGDFKEARLCEILGAQRCIFLSGKRSFSFTRKKSHLWVSKILQNFAALKRKKKKNWSGGASSPLLLKLLRNNLKKSTARERPSTPEGARYTARPQWRWINFGPIFNRNRFGAIV